MKLINNIFFWLPMACIIVLATRMAFDIGQVQKEHVMTWEIPATTVLLLGGFYFFGFLAARFQYRHKEDRPWISIFDLDPPDDTTVEVKTEDGSVTQMHHWSKEEGFDPFEKPFFQMVLYWRHKPDYYKEKDDK